MRQYNLNAMKPPVSRAGPSALTKGPAGGAATLSSAATSLELLRQNIQRNINHDIQSVIAKYLDMYVKPGIENIRNNLGSDAVTEDLVASMCRQILEEAKQMYPVNCVAPAGPPLPPSSGSIVGGSCLDGNSDSNIIEQKFSVPVVVQQQPQQLVSQQVHNSTDAKLPLTSPSSFGIKRESDTDSEASCLSNASKKAKKSKGNSGNSNNKSGDKAADKSGSSNDGASPAKPKKPSGPYRKHVALWDSNRLTIDTLFIMGAKANKALGFAQTRGRLYVKHPGLFKYASDADDKEWLSKNKLMPATGGRAYIMLLEDIEKLAKDNALQATINYDDIQGFKVPDFILDKMRNYINTWKKNYAEEDEKSQTVQRNRNSSKAASTGSNNNNSNSNSAPSQPPQSSQPPPSSVSQTQTQLAVSNHTIPNNNTIVNVTVANMVSNAALPPPSLSGLQHVYPKQEPQQQQQQNHVTQPQPQQHQPSQGLNSFISQNVASVVFYDQSLASTQPHEISDYIQIDKPPPMYPGQNHQQHPNVQQQQQQTPIGNPAGNYIQANAIETIEQALNKGDWAQVSDRSLLQFALQNSRNIGSWDPQDSFDLIDSVTNGGLGGGNGLEDTSPLMQISPNAGAHLAAPPIGPVSPNCELNAVLDQVSAFQYTET